MGNGRGSQRGAGTPATAPVTLPAPRTAEAVPARGPALLPDRVLRRRGRWWEELLVVALGYWLYGLVRNGVPTHEAAALSRALSVYRVEGWLHVDVELAVNKAVASVHWLAVTANYYYATLHFVVTLGVLLWLYVRHPRRYRPVRSVLYLASLVGLVGFWVFPLAPPRMLPSLGYIDTVVVFHTWGSWASGDVANASNQFAAMPSLHLAWALWCGIALVRLSPHQSVKVLGAVYPVLTFAVILATANHFVVDAVGGAVVLGIGFGLQRLLTGRAAFAGVPAPATVPASRA
ncbi:MAG: phosphatase PAP2 family protein [Actinomycetota bacterium]|nr:phosphatase PAP2 family protein [Actinomycetota bacterium]